MINRTGLIRWSLRSMFHKNYTTVNNRRQIFATCSQPSVDLISISSCTFFSMRCCSSKNDVNEVVKSKPDERKNNEVQAVNSDESNLVKGLPPVDLENNTTDKSDLPMRRETVPGNLYRMSYEDLKEFENASSAKDMSTAGRIIDREIEEGRRGQIMTPQEYAELEEKAKILGKENESMTEGPWDNPKWLMHALFWMAIAIGGVIVGGRLKRENTRFDPRLRQTKIIDTAAEEEDGVGGSWELQDCNGKTWTNEDVKGKWLYIYFGFTNCPDICPEEMTKMSRVCRHVRRKVGEDKWQPIFVTVDPKRDTPEVLKEYLSEFSPKILGLTGSPEAVEDMARKYRVFFSVPGHHDPNSADYLIDHSIITYLMDPDGKFCDYTTKEFTWNEAYGKILRRMSQYEAKQVASGRVADEKVAGLFSSIVGGRSE